MKKSTTSTAIVPEAIVEEAWQEVGARFERFCLTVGVATLTGMMEEDAAEPCGTRTHARTARPAIHSLTSFGMVDADRLKRGRY